MKHEFEAIDGTKIRRNKIIAYTNEGGKIFAYTEPNIPIELTHEDGQALVEAFEEDWQILKAKEEYKRKSRTSDYGRPIQIQAHDTEGTFMQLIVMTATAHDPRVMFERKDGTIGMAHYDDVRFLDRD